MQVVDQQQGIALLGGEADRVEAFPQQHTLGGVQLFLICIVVILQLEFLHVEVYEPVAILQIRCEEFQVFVVVYLVLLRLVRLLIDQCH